jgi:hypothetical protein
MGLGAGGGPRWAGQCGLTGRYCFSTGAGKSAESRLGCSALHRRHVDDRLACLQDNGQGHHTDHRHRYERLVVKAIGSRVERRLARTPDLDEEAPGAVTLSYPKLSFWT